MNIAQDIIQTDFPLLIEAGFVAVKQGNRTAAESLFRAAQLLKPSHSAPALGFGYIALQSANLELAQKLFEAVSQKEPDNALAKVLLGYTLLTHTFLHQANKNNPSLAIKKTGNLEELGSRGKLLIEEALKSSDDSAVQLLGKSAIELYQKIHDYNKTPLMK